MNAVNFVYWLQGLFEIGDAKTLNEGQVKIVREHLDMVFKHDIYAELPELPVKQGPATGPLDVKNPGFKWDGLGLGLQMPRYPQTPLIC